MEMQDSCVSSTKNQSVVRFVRQNLYQAESKSSLKIVIRKGNQD